MENYHVRMRSTFQGSDWSSVSSLLVAIQKDFLSPLCFYYKPMHFVCYFISVFKSSWFYFCSSERVILFWPPLWLIRCCRVETNFPRKGAPPAQKSQKIGAFFPCLSRKKLMADTRNKCQAPRKLSIPNHVPNLCLAKKYTVLQFISMS